ncbi:MULTISPECIES: DUF3043 domain-containing protein [unclassified Janibacter]|uniref:DUF3043 domain-containing protein n=1 Tax=unclassified Janibacter TaxID=2649294 RepID=UPI003D08B1C0
MFGRSKSETSPQQSAAAQATPTPREGAKNRPTPKRRDQEAARRQPLVVTDRKAARRVDRDKRREAQLKLREAMATGDDRHLPARDKGPVKRYIRDVVDSRFSLGQAILPLMLVVLVVSLFAAQWATYVFLFTYILLFLGLLDAIRLWFTTKRKILAKFGPDTNLKGHALYLVMRAFQMRRTRMPRPQVAVGQKVD